MFHTARRLKSRLQSAREEGALLGQLLVVDSICFRSWIAIIPQIDRSFGPKKRRELTASVLLLHDHSELYARMWVDFLRTEFLDIPKDLQDRVWGIAQSFLDRPDFFMLVQPELIALLQQYNDIEMRAYLEEAEMLFSESTEKARFFLRQESQRAWNSKKKRQKRTSLDDVHKTLLPYGRARVGKHFQLLPTLEQKAYCDGRNVVLPSFLPFSTEIGEKCYRLLMAKNSAFLEFGTMEIVLDDIEEDGIQWVSPREEELEIERMFRSFPSGLLAKELFFILENDRVERSLCAEYPGVSALFNSHADYLETWSQISEVRTAIDRELRAFTDWLQDPERQWNGLSTAQKEQCIHWKERAQNVQDSIRVLMQIYPHFYSLLLSQGKSSAPKIQTNGDAAIRTDRLSRADRDAEKRTETIQKEFRSRGQRISKQQARELDIAESSSFLDRNPGLSAPQESQSSKEQNDFAVELSKTMTPLAGEFVYSEWDIRIEDWKPGWTRVREFVLPSDYGAFQREFFGEFQADVHRVKRVFQALRLEQQKTMRRLWDGDSIDFERLLDASIAIRSKQDPDLRIYQKTHRKLRDIGVAFLVDMSSSTNELVEKGGKRIIDIEKQALFLIAEALHALGDPFAIYGFSGFGREQVAFYIAKEIDQGWNAETQARLGAMDWKMENRDGAAIRHCTAKMRTWKQKQRLLIVLSDGKPLDCATGEYQEELAQMDTWWALQEARQAGIRPFCITVDPHGKEYLDMMFGQGAYVAIRSIETLPRQLPLIYQQLTGIR